MAQGGQSRMSIVSVVSIALAVCAMIAAISFAATVPVDTGRLNESETQVCDNYKLNLPSALHSEYLACHICCAIKHRSSKYLIKGTEVSADKCQCVIQAIKED